MARANGLASSMPTLLSQVRVMARSPAAMSVTAPSRRQTLVARRVPASGTGIPRREGAASMRAFTSVRPALKLGNHPHQIFIHSTARELRPWYHVVGVYGL